MTRARGTHSERCPECGGGPYSPRGLTIHRRLKHSIGVGDQEQDVKGPSAGRVETKRRATAGPRARPITSDADFATQGFKLVKNLATCSIFVGILLPTTAATLVRRLGDRPYVDPMTGEPIEVQGVPQMRRGIGSVVMDAARQDERIMAGVLAFNRFFDAEDAIQIGLGLVASVAVDMGVDPDMSLNLGPLGELRPIHEVIGDVLEEMGPGDQEQDVASPYETPAASPNGATTDGAGVIPGGVTQT